MRNFLCIGHRGAKGLEPENTLRSIRRALDLGVDGVEIDAWFVDGEVIVIHDDTLERTTNGHGLVQEQTFDYLRSLDAGKGEKIPTLREVF
ncbi:MAG TPA: glycerophosphodiester phosphodiesterase family protein, partial [Chthoniobacteraceae bacterium]|nr:glycerophosphodiester phosphodiesterase family protein [Chthoniobacteraceae bacterium]